VGVFFFFFFLVKVVNVGACRLLTQSAVEVGMVWRLKLSVILRLIVL